MSNSVTATRRVLIGPHEGPVNISKLMPTVATDEILVDVWIRHLYIVNKSGATSTILLCDRASPPVYLMSVSLPDGGMLSLTDDDGVYMKSGITWSSSQTNVSVKMAGSTKP